MLVVIQIVLTALVIFDSSVCAAKFTPKKQLRKSYRSLAFASWDNGDDFDTINRRVKVNGLPLFEGDMVMNDEMLMQILGDESLSHRQRRKLHKMWKGSQNRRQKRAAVKSEYKLWGNGDPIISFIGDKKITTQGLLPYVFDDNIQSWKRALILRAIQHWEQKTSDNSTEKYCIKFLPRTDEEHYIRFVDSEGCWSSVGKSPESGPQKVSIGPRCATMGLIAHELGHAIGFFHEQSRPDRDQYIKVVNHNVLSSRRFNFIKYQQYLIDPREVAYDYGSIMHYKLNAFSKNGRNTLRPIKSHNVPEIGQRTAASDKDILQVRKMYGCDLHIEEEATEEEAPEALTNDVAVKSEDKDKKDLYVGHWTWDFRKGKWIWNDV